MGNNLAAYKWNKMISLRHEIGRRLLHILRLYECNICTSSGLLLVIAEPHTILYRAWQVKKQTFMYKLFKKVKHFIQKHTVINTNL